MASTVRIIEICRITPPPESVTESSLPLTFLDTFSAIYPQNEGIFFYELTADSSFSSILQKFKKSLSLTLLHFHPFAGNLVWPSHSDKPFILYTPGDGISLSVAESTADFHILCGYSVREALESRLYIPEPNSSDAQAEIMSFQITYFPNQGFCIGFSFNHTVFDAKSTHMFFSAWAHICKHSGEDNSKPSLPPQLTPFIDRTVIQDPDGLDVLCLRVGKQSDENSRSLKVQRTGVGSDHVRARFKLSNEEITKIRQMALISSKTKNEAKFSRFVLVYSYVAIAIAKAKRIGQEIDWQFRFDADARGRLDAAIPANYFGNCTTPCYMLTKVGRFLKDDGLNFVAQELTKMIQGLEEGALVRMKQIIQELQGTRLISTPGTGVAASPRFHFYGLDFGWGKPKLAEYTSIDYGLSFSMLQQPDENAIEVGVVLKKHEMDTFRSLFFGDFHARL